MTRRTPLLIGITGPIGCGKSTVAAILHELGGEVIDADVLARRATDPGRATLPAIRARFGDEVFTSDGELDRSAMATVVFADPAALADLELIVHPEVRKMVDATLEKASADDAPFVVIEAIKLVEGGLAQRCDEVWLIECLRALVVFSTTRSGWPGAGLGRRSSGGDQGGGNETLPKMPVGKPTRLR